MAHIWRRTETAAYRLFRRRWEYGRGQKGYIGVRFSYQRRCRFLVRWRQKIISLATTESEYIAATHAAKEALWLCSLITQLFEVDLAPTVLFCDNQSAIELTKDHQYHSRTKHTDIRFHFIRWIVYCPTDEMLADALTKLLPSAKVKHFAARLGLLPA